jgi:hypothetical protein
MSLVAGLTDQKALCSAVANDVSADRAARGAGVSDRNWGVKEVAPRSGRH